MTPFSKNPITYIWKQVAMLYMTSVTCDSVEKITVPTYSYLYSQNDSLAKLSIRCECKFPLIGRAPQLKK